VTRWSHGPLAAAVMLMPLPAAAQKVSYYHLDAIGNVRVVTDASATVVERRDYAPFGEECTTGPCTANLGFASNEPRRFTGKERDLETGLDYFGARYYAAKNARFTTVDPDAHAEMSLLAPQRWNRYTYGRNNPLRFLDPDGRADFVVFDAFASSELHGGSRPDWAGLKAAAEKRGHTLTVYSGDAATTEAFQTSISTPGLHVIDVGHAVEDEGMTVAVGVNLTNGAIGELGRTARDQPMIPPYGVNATSVNLFGCNSDTLKEQYAGAGTFTGVQSGHDGTNSVTLERAAAAFLRSATSRLATQPVNLSRAQGRAQAAIDRSRMRVDGASIDKGDHVIQSTP
jgi:RHS repeat-associated protein